MIVDIFLEEAAKIGLSEKQFVFSSHNDRTGLAWAMPTFSSIKHFLLTGYSGPENNVHINFSPNCDRLSFPARKGVAKHELIHAEQYLLAKKRKKALSYGLKYIGFDLTNYFFRDYIRDVEHLIDLTIASEGGLSEIWLFRQERAQMAGRYFSTKYNFAYPSSKTLDSFMDDLSDLDRYISHYKSILGVSNIRYLFA